MEETQDPAGKLIRGFKSYPTIVIGAGAGGLVIALGLAAAKKKVLLVERGEWGGDCTNFGCIPSKSLIASAEAAHAQRAGSALGLEGGAPFSSAKGALERVRRIIAEVRSHEDAQALSKRGVDVLEGEAHFVDPHTLEVNGQKIRGDRIVIATGSSPMVPAIEGLRETPFLTNETIFDLQDLPKCLVVLGGGVIGSELAQAFARLGSRVTLVHRGSYLLKREEEKARQVIAKRFEDEGIELCLGKSPTSISYDGEFEICFEKEKLACDQLLIAVGRAANVQSLSLEKAGVDFSPKGIPVDDFGRTNVKHIFGVGDVIGEAQFTHAAENQARAVLTTLLLPVKKRKDVAQAVPRVTYTDPEVASFGPSEKEAVEEFGPEAIKSYFVPMEENDRAVTAGRTEGFVKLITFKDSGKILGATIVGPRAGEMLPELSLAAREKIPLKKLATLIHPYPTYSLAIRKAADKWLTEVFLPKVQHPLKALHWKRFLPLIIIVALMVIAYLFGVHKYITFEFLQTQHAQIKAFVQAHPVITPILYTILYAVATSLSLPGGAILSLLGGFLFPVPWSTIYVLIGATIGASLIFLAAKTAFADFFKKKAGGLLKKMEKGFKKNAWSYLLFLRFVPLFPFWLVNIAPAFFGVPFLTYLWTTFVGIIPGAYVYTQTGEGLGAIFAGDATFSLETVFNVKLRIALIALGIFALVPIFLKKWFSRRRQK